MFDLQVNGLTTQDFSCDFWEAPDDESINALCKKQYKDGVSNILATLITAPYNKIEQNLERIKEYKDKFDSDRGVTKEDKRSHIYGVHMEGGLISKLGIHPAANAQEFNLENAKSLVAKFPGLIKLWTLCPKMDTNGDITKFLQDQEIKVAYGHSDCTYDEAEEAFTKYNVNLVTHWGNAMKSFPGFKHRGGSNEDILKLINLDMDQVLEREEIGLAVAAYKNPNIYVTAICGSERDGDLHLDPPLIHELADAKPGKFILVSDSVACPGLYENGEYHKPDTLRGGLKGLGTHIINAFETSLGPETVQAASSITPYEVLGVSAQMN